MDHPFVQLVADAAREAYGEVTDVVRYPTAAGSGPMHPIGRTLGVPIVSTGMGYYGSRAHAPDENIRLADFEAGAYHMAVSLKRFGRA